MRNKHEEWCIYNPEDSLQGDIAPTLLAIVSDGVDSFD